MFEKLTETEAVTLYTLLELGNHAVYNLPWADYTVSHSLVTAEAAETMGHLAWETFTGRAKSRVLLDVIDEALRRPGHPDDRLASVSAARHSHV